MEGISARSLTEGGMTGSWGVTKSIESLLDMMVAMQGVW